MRPHVNPLSGAYLERPPERIDLPADRPVEVELGSGDGRFLFERVRAAPGGFYLGVEIRPEWVERVRARRVANVTAVYANLVVATDLFARASVTRFHVNFPDPLFKRRHRVRRWLTPGAARGLARALRPGGEVFFQSDVFEAALDALAVLEGEPALANAEGGWRFARENRYGARSRREAWCDEHGVRVWRLRFFRR